MSLGYFGLDLPRDERKAHHKRQQELYPTLAKLDEKVDALFQSKKAQEWDTARKQVEASRINPIFFLERYGFIRAGEMLGGAEEVGIIPFRLNTEQLQISNRVCVAFLTKPWSRVQAVVLKHRKAGISTLCAGFDYWFLRFVKNINAFIIADLGGHTDNIMSMIDLYHERDECGKGLAPEFRPPVRKAMTKNKKGLRFSNNSMAEQDSGENSNPGTSGTINVCHMSENSKWRDPENAETSLLNSIPRKGFVFIIKESTAYGLNKYARDCEDAEKGKSNWLFIFISWKDLEDCEYEIEPGEKLEYTGEEREIAAAYKLRPGHIKFRRSQIQMLGSSERFKQDFPLNSREPFLITGSNFFNTAIVQDRLNEVRFFRDWREHGMDYVTTHYPEIIERAKVHPRGSREALAVIEERNVTPTRKCITINNGIVTFVPEPSGGSKEAVTIFHLPQRRKRYLVIIDVAEGIQTDEYTSDNSIVHVLDTYCNEQVAEWGGLFDEEITAYFGVCIAKAYNNAEIVPEMNNRCGGLLKAELQKLGYRHIFHRQKVSAKGSREKLYGWETTAGNKKEVCGQFKLSFKNGDCRMHSIPLLEEMLYFVDSKGKLGASSGTDDRVMAASIGDKVIADSPSYRRLMDAPRSRRSERASGPQAHPQYRNPMGAKMAEDQKKQDALRRHM